MEATTALADIGGRVRTAAERFGSATVGVGRGWRVGTGAIFAPARVLTAARHVGGGATTITFGGGRTEQGTLLGIDRDLGVAVIEVDTGEIEPLEWGDDFEPAIGAPVIALGNPGGRGLRATIGL